MDKLKVQMVPIENLHPYEHNPRNNEDAVDPVAASIREFGFKVPIIVDQSMTIAAGHTRYLAAKKLGLTEVPVIMAEDLSSEQIQAYRIVDNKTQEQAKWDYRKLDEELEKIENIDMSLFRFGDIGDFEPGEGLREQDLDDGGEVSIDEFEDENFNCECPVCGFRWNEKEEE